MIGRIARGILGLFESTCFFVCTLLVHWLRHFWRLIFHRSRERRHWQWLMDHANNYTAWSDAARHLDRLDGLHVWKKQEGFSPSDPTQITFPETKKPSELFDEETLLERLQQLQAASDLGDDSALAFLVRTSLARDFADIDNPRLFDKCRVDTHVLVEEFVDEMVRSIHHLTGSVSEEDNLSILRSRMAYFKDLRHSLGNTALLLSGGGGLGIYHVGVLKALYESNLLPRIICGASSGSIMASIACCRTDDMWPAMLRMEGISCHALEDPRLLINSAVGASAFIDLAAAETSRNSIDSAAAETSRNSIDSAAGKANGNSIDLAAAETNGNSTDSAAKQESRKSNDGQKERWYSPLVRLMNEGPLYDGRVLRQSMRENIGDITFLEAYQKTARVLNVAVSSPSAHDMPCLLNYITAPHVLVWSAVVASCAVPALFESASLLAKDFHGRIVPWTVASDDRWIDGSVDNDLPMQRLSEMFNVNHFVVSQVNLHIYPFIKWLPFDTQISPVNADLRNRTRKSRSRRRTRSGLWHGLLLPVIWKMLMLARSELVFRCNQLIQLGVFVRFCQILRGVLKQKYYGDITIVPNVRWTDIRNIIKDRPVSQLIGAIRLGEQATWPKITAISCRLRCELAIDEAIFSLRDRIHQMVQSTDSSSISPLDLDPQQQDLSEDETDAMADPHINISRHIPRPASSTEIMPSSPSLRFPRSASDMDWRPQTTSSSSIDDHASVRSTNRFKPKEPLLNDNLSRSRDNLFHRT